MPELHVLNFIHKALYTPTRLLEWCWYWYKLQLVILFQ